MSAIVRALHRVSSLHPLIKDGLLSAVLTGALLVDLSRQTLPPASPFREADLLGYVLVALLTLPLAVRTLLPVATYLTILAAATTTAALLYRPSSFGFGLVVATYTVARWRDRRTSIPVVSISLAFGLGAKLRAVAAGVTPTLFDWPLDLVYFGAAWFLGDSIRVRNQYAQELEASRAALAERAVAEERLRIARELHDAVGHSVSVMVLHAGGGEELLEPDPDRARRAFRAIARVGRAALTEMDRLIGLLRSPDEYPDAERATLGNLRRLVDNYRELGLDIRTSIEDQPDGLSTAVEQSAYRIIEESLTNTIKHAGPTTAEVSVAYDDGHLRLRVRDHGVARSPRRRPPTPGHHGRGLIGMQERAALVHGHISAAPHPDGGFEVTATLPIEEAQT